MKMKRHSFCQSSDSELRGLSSCGLSSCRESDECVEHSESLVRPASRADRRTGDYLCGRFRRTLVHRFEHSTHRPDDSFCSFRESVPFSGYLTASSHVRSSDSRGCPLHPRTECLRLPVLYSAVVRFPSIACFSCVSPMDPAEMGVDSCSESVTLRAFDLLL